MKCTLPNQTFTENYLKKVSSKPHTCLILKDKLQTKNKICLTTQTEHQIKIYEFVIVDQTK